jgi:hypothetical protein
VPRGKNYRYLMKSRDGVTVRKDGLEKGKFFCTFMGNETSSLRS